MKVGVRVKVKVRTTVRVRVTVEPIERVTRYGPTRRSFWSSTALSVSWMRLVDEVRVRLKEGWG